MINNDLIVKGNFLDDEFNIVFNQNNEDKKMSPQYFLDNYKILMSRYVANGDPSKDTIRSYFSAIDQFIEWCQALKIDIFKVTEQQLLYYRSVFIKKGYKPTSIKFKLTSIRRFYYVAIKYKLIKENPALMVHAQRDPDSYMPITKFLTLDQLQIFLDSIPESKESDLRLKTMIVLMAIEGLRTVEVYRMNTQDISFEMRTIYIRGKGHNDMIYPSALTMKLLYRYINKRKSDGSYPTPVFTSLSHENLGKRISRTTIRKEIDKALRQNNFKDYGKSCHMLRHTCGTLLYRETKDLQVVKEVLRHRSVEMTSKYSHIQDNMVRRYTSSIPIRPEQESE